MTIQQPALCKYIPRSLTTFSRALVASAVFATLWYGDVQAQAPLPLLPDMTVVTCEPYTSPSAPRVGYVLAALDTRDPLCNAPAFTNPPSPPPNWAAPAYHGPASEEWTAANFKARGSGTAETGSIFGVTVDDSPAPNIYVSSTSIFSDVPGTANSGSDNSSGDVFKIDGTTGFISLLATLPNNGQGLGNIAYDRYHNQLWVSNFHDGQLYRLSTSGTILGQYDPLTIGQSQVGGWAPLGERPWGVNVHCQVVSPPSGCRVYFSIWSQDMRNPQAGPNTVRSAELDASGAVVPNTDVIEFTVPPYILDILGMYSHPIADIAFAPDNMRMLLGTRSMQSNYYEEPHEAQVFELTGGASGAWASSLVNYQVGIQNMSSVGGVDYTSRANPGPCYLDQYAVFTGDLHFTSGGAPNIYGIQMTPVTGGNLYTSHLIDLDQDTSAPDKRFIGSLEVVRELDASNPPVTATTPSDVMVGGENLGALVLLPTAAVQSGPSRPVLVLLSAMVVGLLLLVVVTGAAYRRRQR